MHHLIKHGICRKIHGDCLVYYLYGLTYDEVLIVDPTPPFTREEYEKRKRTKNAEILKGFLIKNAEILKDAHLIYAKNLNTY